MKRGVLTTILAGVMLFSVPAYSSSSGPVIPFNNQQVVERSLEDRVKEEPVKPVSYEARTYKVDRVIDGDTIDVIDRGEIQRVRFIGVDTPERWAPLYNEATRRTRSLIFQQGHGQVTLINYLNEENVDDHGRLLAYPFVNDGESMINVGKTLIEESLASAYCFRGRVKHYTQTFADAQNRALEGGRQGIWDDFENFDNYRRTRRNMWKIKRYVGRLRKGVQAFEQSQRSNYVGPVNSLVYADAGLAL